MDNSHITWGLRVAGRLMLGGAIAVFLAGIGVAFLFGAILSSQVSLLLPLLILAGGAILVGWMTARSLR